MSKDEYSNTNGHAGWMRETGVQMLPYWNLLGACAKAAEPMARGAARANLELSSLAGQRMRAYASISERTAQCRTPFDLLQAQAAFWQEAGRQYADASRHIVEAWQGVLPQLAGGAVPEKAALRDYINLPEGQQPVTDSEQRQQQRQPADRRAA